VRALRAQLARACRGDELAGLDAGPADDLFDEALEDAIRAFQQRRGLLCDGVVGAQTARALEAAQWRLGDRVLMYTAGHPMRGDDVAALQERLLMLGLLSGPVDGIFEGATDAALREFQHGIGLTGDGLCGPATLRGLDSLARSVGGGDPWALRQQAGVASSGKSLAGKAVVLDPGFGLEAVGGLDGAAEAEITWDLAQRVAGRLEATGVTAPLTRGRTGRPDDAERACLAAAVRADMLISLHCERHRSPRASGVATFYWGDDRVGTRSAVGERLATLVQRELVARTGMIDCRTHPRTFELLRRTTMPAVWVDVGYLSNSADFRRLHDPAFRDVTAEAIVVAVQRLYLGEDDATTGTLRLADVLEHAGRLSG
jgi:N-acetylmuramoyl-L-alanine amidase